MADYDNPRPSSQPTGSTEGAVGKDNLITLDRIMTAPTGTEITNRKGDPLTPMADIVGDAQGVVQAAVDAVAADTIQNTEDIAAVGQAAADNYKKAIEDASGGRNTVIVDAQGNPNVMVRIAPFMYEDLNAAVLDKFGVDLELGAGLPTMFQTDGVSRKDVLIAKYLASSGKNGGCSVVGGVQPKTYVSYDTAKSLCENKGEGWHLMSIHEWAAIALWSLANGTVPRGNTNYGRSHANKLETAIRADNEAPGEVPGVGRTGTGTGPVAWAHDHTAWGIHDLVGNVAEWIDQMMMDDGQVVATLDNDPSVQEANWYKHGAYLDSPVASQDGTGSAGSPILNNAVTKRNGPLGDDSNDYPYLANGHFAAIAKGDNYNPSEILRRLLIESTATETVVGAIYARNYGSRFPLRGGDWGDGSSAGLGMLNLSHGRSFAYSRFGFRPAFFA